MDYSKAVSYWVEKEKNAVRMDRNELLTRVEKFIMTHNTCALATGFSDFVRCTPIEYNYKDGRFWLLSEGGLKFRGLEGNKNVCLAIYDEYTGFDKLGGMQVNGVAEIVEPGTNEYMELLALKNISAQKLKQLPTTLYLIKVTPTSIDFVCSEIHRLGFDTRQHLCFSDSHD
ncbi:pyridoxamine 5'-phosphate oxidase-related FMN-binding protein [Ruminiclostridium papyrosolvens DSM 2782]|uniref:Pyridoxamine 5'-phosphate oxidase-related FMN-binding protein n=1 Tax=Ruminiclostridium papyrosolvens DSM 2782 TaxID=588581 RepID=F1TIC2_9FIRM|nr:pyridoxamine 5'-phosphate oxidase family protein [Ruminiclostridium papyrosolvens]EGD45900.1 pyridoxamine 5'-phosphate oxidase-related FMN-binding protein [Ruminiclostridium papyrosolvens DSM 2782]WES36380.1 pyridoxamine 5'-phosphate oxidase family protein [Ruminiclostridium papyrosolvens DSM 2782]